MEDLVKKDIFRQLAVSVTTIFTLIMNGAANAIPLNGRLTGEISDSFAVIFVPAGYVFAIWGVIYIALLGYTIYHSIPRHRTNPILRSTGWLVALSSILNGAWIYFWHFGFYGITVIVMLALLVTLLLAYQKAHREKNPVPRSIRWLVCLPLSIYLGWISVATIANVTAYLAYLGWTGWGITPQGWTLLLLGISVLLAGLMAYRFRDIAFSLVFVWAVFGIGVRWAGSLPVIQTAGYISAVLILIILLLARSRKNVL